MKMGTKRLKKAALNNNDAKLSLTDQKKTFKSFQELEKQQKEFLEIQSFSFTKHQL